MPHKKIFKKYFFFLGANLGRDLERQSRRRRLHHGGRSQSRRAWNLVRVRSRLQAGQTLVRKIVRTLFNFYHDVMLLFIKLSNCNINFSIKFAVTQDKLFFKNLVIKVQNTYFLHNFSTFFHHWL